MPLRGNAGSDIIVNGVRVNGVSEEVPHCVGCQRDVPQQRRGWDALDEAELCHVCPACKKEAKS